MPDLHPTRRTLDRCLAALMCWGSGFVAASIPFAWTFGSRWGLLGTCALSLASLVIGIWGVCAPWDHAEEEEAPHA